MEKSFIDIFVQLADEADKTEAKRVARNLKKNGIDSITRLINMSDGEIAALNGIGVRAMKVISTIKTREIAKAAKAMNSYKKQKSKEKKICKTFKDYAMACGMSYISACQFEHALKHGGINSFDDLLNTPQETISQIRGIGPKRLQACMIIKSMATGRKRTS